ncbi:hypothetical protein ACVDG5_034700 [Mesorhizobium sp. ORM6]
MAIAKPISPRPTRIAMPSISSSIVPASRAAFRFRCFGERLATGSAAATTAGTKVGESCCTDLLRPKAIPTGDLGNDCVGLQRLRDDPRLVIHRPMTPTASTVDHLETPKLPLRVKRKVKSRHKPISDPNTGSATSQIATAPERWSGNTALTTFPTDASFHFVALSTTNLAQIAMPSEKAGIHPIWKPSAKRAMTLSLACQPWHADQPGPIPESTATNTASHTTPWDTIHISQTTLYILIILKLTAFIAAAVLLLTSNFLSTFFI